MGDLGVNVMWVAALVSLGVSVCTWAAVAVVGLLRGAPRAKMMFVGAGAVGMACSLLIPSLHYLAGFLLYDRIGYENIGFVQAGITAVNTLVGLAPWLLLLLGIWRSRLSIEG